MPRSFLADVLALLVHSKASLRGLWAWEAAGPITVFSLCASSMMAGCSEGVPQGFLPTLKLILE